MSAAARPSSVRGGGRGTAGAARAARAARAATIRRPARRVATAIDIHTQTHTQTHTHKKKKKKKKGRKIKPVTEKAINEMNKKPHKTQNMPESN